MAKLNFSWIAVFALGLASCVPPPVAIIIAPKALVIKEAGVAPVAVPLPELTAAGVAVPLVVELPKVNKAPVTLPKSANNDGLRIPNMLELPNDREFRSAGSAAPKTGSEPGAIISKPPTESPAPAKPPAQR
jgi:hypothetical protein